MERLIYPDNCRPLKMAAEQGDLEMRALARGNYPGDRLHRDDLPGIRSIGLWDAKKEQSFGLPLHRNEGIEFTLCEAGHVSFTCENKGELLSSHMMTITRPWQPHQVGNPNIEASRLHWIILDVGVRRPHQEWIWPDWIILNREDLRALTRLLRENEKPVWKGSPETVKLFKSITSRIGGYGQEGSESYLKLLINELLLNILIQLKQQKPGLGKDLVSSERNMELFIEELPHMIEYDWNSRSMAEYCKLKSTRFIFYCKKLTNMSPIQYLHYLRIKKARQLLAESEKSVTDIAFDCGFSSSQYFYRIFRRQTGLSPQEFRKRAADS